MDGSGHVVSSSGGRELETVTQPDLQRLGAEGKLIVGHRQYF